MLFGSGDGEEGGGGTCFGEGGVVVEGGGGGVCFGDGDGEGGGGECVGDGDGA